MSDNQSSQNPQVPVSSSSQSASSDINRPDSIDSADSSNIPADSTVEPPSDKSAENLTEPPISTPSATPVSDTSPPEPVVAPNTAPLTSIGPVSSVPADSPSLSTSPLPATASASAGSSPPETSTPIPEEKPPESPSQQPDLSAEASAKEDINVSSPDNQPPQVQSEPSDNASTIDRSRSENQSAEIKPEPLESPQEAPLADNNPQNSSQKSFGDLLSSNAGSTSQPVSDQTTSGVALGDSPEVKEPVAPSSSPPISFGDLIKDIKLDKSIVSPPPMPSEPIVSSSSSSKLITGNPQPASLLPAITPISPITQDKLVLLRQQAKQKKAQKQQTTLQKIIDLAKTKGKINNQEAQKILHLPQSTLSDYFKELVSGGLLKKEGKGKATYYHL